MVVCDKALVGQKLKVIAVAPDRRARIGFVRFEAAAAEEGGIERKNVLGREVRAVRDLNVDTTATSVGNTRVIIPKAGRGRVAHVARRIEHSAVTDKAGKLALIERECADRTREGRAAIARDRYILCVVFVVNEIPV